MEFELIRFNVEVEAGMEIEGQGFELLPQKLDLLAYVLPNDLPHRQSLHPVCVHFLKTILLMISVHSIPSSYT